MTQNIMTCRRGRPPGLTLNRIANWYTIAGALIADITVAAAARQLGLSRSWASREANAAGTKILVAELLDSQRDARRRARPKVIPIDWHKSQITDDVTLNYSAPL